MVIKGFRYDFTAKELLYLKFGKKQCPNCGGALKQEKTCEIVDGDRFNRKSAPTFVPGAEVKHYQYLFHCTACGASFKLSELAN